MADNITSKELRSLAKEKAKSENIPLAYIGQRGTADEHKAYLSGIPYAQAYPNDPKKKLYDASATEVDAGSEPLQPKKDQEQITDTGPTDQDALDEEEQAPPLKLAPNHLEDLRKSGLTDATISKAGIESIRPCDISRILGYESTEIESIYRIPFDANYSRSKLFYKTAAAPEHKRPKYIQPRGSINRLYIPPTFPQSELKSLSTIRIVEGEKKTLKAIQEGITAIGITGLWNWKIKGTDELIPDFEPLTISGRKFEIVPDSDWLDLDKDGKPRNLKQAVYALATALMLKGAIVGIVTLPKSGADKVGLDDYLLDHTKADFEELECKAVSARSCFLNTAYFLYYHEFDRDKGKYKHPVKVASAIYVMAYSRNHSNESWGLMLRFKDADKNIHDWAMPKEMLGCDIGLVCKKLLNFGLPYIYAARQLLQEYLMTVRPEKNRRVRCVDRTGWYGSLFVLPKRTLGRIEDEETIYQGTCPSVISSKGTAEEWRDKIGRYCSGNSRLLFAISMSLAAPLLHIVGAENGGVNSAGGSSIGKSTALKIGCSVWGDEDYAQNWKTTDNHLEAIAQAHNDLFMGVDELSQAKSELVGDIIYMLGNGHGKGRANRNAEARPTKKWRTCFYSSSEKTVSECMALSGKKSNAGQEIRLLDIPADTGKHGIFEDLHGFDSGAEFSKYLCQAVKEYHGQVGIQYLNQIISDMEDLPDNLRSGRAAFIKSVCPVDADGQVVRAAGFLGIIAAAGEYATSVGLTGWQPKQATEAAAVNFKAWLSQRGGHGAKEIDRILEDMRLYFENHGDSRFANKDKDDRVIINRAGYYDDDHYYVLTETFQKEILKGHSFNLAKKVLIEQGILLTDSGSDRRTRKISVDGKKINVFVIHRDRLNGVDENDC